MVEDESKSDNDITLDREILSKVMSYKVMETIVTSFETISKRAYEASKASKGHGKSRINYRVTDLCNPMHAYYEFIRPDIKDPKELVEKFDYGNFAEKKALELLSNEEGFVVSQGDVDGSTCGMNNVKGRIDFRIKDMIIEFKTSEYDIPDVSTLFSRNPQNLEQLLIYALFTERTNRSHLLLYIIGRDFKTSARAFEVKIKDRDTLIMYFSDRLKSLKSAVDNRDSKGLGKCRYFNSICKFKKNGICNCSSEADLPIDEIEKSVHINCVKEGTNKTIIEGIVTKFNDPQLMQDYNNSFGLWDIFSPRRWYLKHIDPFIYSAWDVDSKSNYYLRLKNEEEFVKENLLTKQPIANNIPELRSGLFIEDHLYGDKSSGCDHKKYPFLVRVQEMKYSYKSKLPDIYLAQLGLACALSEDVKGYIFIFYKNEEAGVLYKVIFNKLGYIRQKALEILKNSIDSISQKKLNIKLPLCPEYVRKSCYEDCLCKMEP